VKVKRRRGRGRRRERKEVTRGVTKTEGRGRVMVWKEARGGAKPGRLGPEEVQLEREIRSSLTPQLLPMGRRMGAGVARPGEE
jgi:hypothetical protein